MTAAATAGIEERIEERALALAALGEDVAYAADCWIQGHGPDRYRSLAARLEGLRQAVDIVERLGMHAERVTEAARAFADGHERLAYEHVLGERPVRFGKREADERLPWLRWMLAGEEAGAPAPAH